MRVDSGMQNDSYSWWSRRVRRRDRMRRCVCDWWSRNRRFAARSRCNRRLFRHRSVAHGALQGALRFHELLQQRLEDLQAVGHDSDRLLEFALPLLQHRLTAERLLEALLERADVRGHQCLHAR